MEGWTNKRLDDYITCAFLTLCMLLKNFSRQYFVIFFLIFLQNRIWHFIQIVSLGYYLHEVSNPFLQEKKNQSLLSAGFDHTMVNVKQLLQKIQLTNFVS